MNLRALRRALGPLALALSPLVAACGGAAPAPESAAGFQLPTLPFPKKDELARLSSAPPPVSTEPVEDTPAVSRWELTGPLPDALGDGPFEPATTWEKMLAELLPKDGTKTLSRAMVCAARESSAFTTVHGRPPGGALLDVIAARCGAPFGSFSLATSTVSVEDAVPDKQLEKEIGPKYRTYLQEVLGKAQPSVGIAAVRKNGKLVVGFAAYEPTVALEPTSLLPDAEGNIRLRGKVHTPAVRFSVLVSRGDREVGKCVLDPKVAPPSFSATCAVDRNDPVAWIEVVRFQEGRLVGASVLEGNVYPAGKVVSVYEEATPPPDGAGAPAERFASAVNGVRAKLGISALALDAGETQTSTGLAPHYFASSSGTAPTSLADTVALGLMAGWDVGAPVREGRFGAYQIPGNGRPEDLARYALERPVGRALLLDPACSRIAVGLVGHDGRGGKGVAAVAATYATVEPRSQAELGKLVLDRVDAARAAKGLPPVARLPLLDKDAETAAGWVEDGIQPGAAMDGFMKRVVEQTQTDVRGMAGLVPSLEGLEPPAELVNTPKLALAVSVASYRPEGSPWVMWVVLWAALAPREQTAGVEPWPGSVTLAAAGPGAGL